MQEMTDCSTVAEGRVSKIRHLALDQQAALNIVNCTVDQPTLPRLLGSGSGAGSGSGSDGAAPLPFKPALRISSAFSPPILWTISRASRFAGGCCMYTRLIAALICSN